MINSWKRWGIIACILFVFFIWGNGLMDMTSPDEVFYSQTAREMNARHSWSVPYLFGQPQFEKPILLYWLLKVSFLLFKDTNFAARLFPALFAGAGVIAVYLFCMLGFGERKKAYLAGFVTMSAVLYLGLARTVFTDMIFTVFIAWSLLSFFWGYVNPKRKGWGLVLFFLFSGLAVLTKGPLGLLIPFITILVFLAIKKQIRFLFDKWFLAGFVLFLLAVLPWYILMIKDFKGVFIREFFYNDHWRRIVEAEHKSNDTWYFYPLTMIGGMFPWSVFTLLGLGVTFRDIFRRQVKPVHLFCGCWIVAVLAIFQFAHSKLASYIFPLFPCLAILSADFLDNLVYRGRQKLKDGLFWINWAAFLVIPAGLIWGVLHYPEYLHRGLWLYCFMGLEAGLLLAMMFLILKKRYLTYIYACGLQIIAVLFFALYSHTDLDPYVSSRKACEYLTRSYAVENTIICSKPFVRGVLYYTGKDVAVIDINGSNFFSPHPIAYLNSERKVRDLLKSQPLTYCVLKKSGWEDLKRVVGNEFSIQLLGIVGNEYLARVDNIAAGKSAG
jgi:4-amino-4-deoxy-L-arabinose transferase-like glycosyltransferase